MISTQAPQVPPRPNHDDIEITNVKDKETVHQVNINKRSLSSLLKCFFIAFFISQR